MKGIIIIDIATYLLALVTLISVRIPQPERTQEVGKSFSVFKDVAFGWHYLVARKGLLGLLLYFASVNFFMNLSAVMLGPLILSFGSATSLGIAQTVMGVGMLAGSLIMSVWGGFKTGKVKAIIGFIVLSAIGFMVAGLRPSVIYVSAGLFFLMFFLPFGSGPSAALFAAKVAPDVQGRVFATQSMISQSMMPVAFLLSGILADHVFNPLLVEGGALANTFVGRWLGVGPSRGIGLMMIASGLILTVVSLLTYLNPRIRNIESEIPDAILDEGGTDIPVAGTVEMAPVE
jgi:MFS family permease